MRKELLLRGPLFSALSLSLSLARQGMPLKMGRGSAIARARAVLLLLPVLTPTLGEAADPDQPGHDAFEKTQPTAVLSNGNTLPLVGVGIGNLDRAKLPEVLGSAQTLRYQLIDTAAASQNEHLLAGMIEGACRGRVCSIVARSGILVYCCEYCCEYCC